MSLLGSRALPFAFAGGASLLFGHQQETWSIGGHASEQKTAWRIESAWESRYFSEGRDVLDGDDLIHNSIDWSRGPLAFGLWHGISSGQEYEELKSSAAISGSWRMFDMYASYTHLRFPDDGSHDHEFAAGVAWHDGPFGLKWALDATHSLEADGFFVETTVMRSWDLADGFTLDLSAIGGLNEGFVPDGHDGSNHLAFRLGLSRALTDSLNLRFHGTWSQAIGRKDSLTGDRTLEDFLHCGVGLEWVY